MVLGERRPQGPRPAGGHGLLRFSVLNAPDDLADDLDALLARVMHSFVVRCLLRFVRMQGFDRAIVISSQMFTALIPLFVLVATFTPAEEENAISRGIIERFALSGEAADAVHELFDTPPGATSGMTVFSALLLVYAGIAFTRRAQRMYRAAWDAQKRGLRSTVSAGLGLVAILVGITVGSSVRSLAGLFPFDWLAMAAISFLTGVVLWTLIPYLLLDRVVHWRRLLCTGVTTAAAMTALSLATPVYMPELIVQYADQFGLFGITITLIGWLLAAACVAVAAACVGAEVDDSDAHWALRVKVRCRLLDPTLPTPAVPEGRDPRGLNVEDVRTLLRLLVNWSIMVGAVWAATTAVPGISVEGSLLAFAAVALLLGLVNVLIGPLLFLVVGFRPWIGVAGSALVVNTVLLGVTALLTDQLEIDGVGSALLGAAVIAVSGTVLTLVLRPITDLVGLRRRVVRGEQDAAPAPTAGSRGTPPGPRS